MSNEQFRSDFRIESYDDFLLLLSRLRLPPKICCRNGTSASDQYALAIVLRRLAYPNRWNDLMAFFGREKSQLSRIFNRTIELIYEKHGYLLESLNQPWLSRENIDRYARAIEEASGGLYENCWGFIDGTGRPICRPSVEQREFYSGHSRQHMIKFQSVLAPDGLIVNLWGPAEGKRHDCYMLGRSNLRERLRAKNCHWHRQFCLYGDKGYPISDEIQTPFKGSNLTSAQVQFNLTMSNLRVAVEYGFGEIARQFAFCGYRPNQRIFWQQCSKAYLVSALLVNCRTCMYGFRGVCRIFKIEPPPLDRYLRFDEFQD